MNIEQYRAAKAQIEKETQETEQTQTQEKPIVKQEETTDTTQTKESLPEKIELEIDGQKVEVQLDELKNGYLRQSDYTRKTQEVSKKSKELEDAVVLYEYLKSNPQIAKKIVEGSDGATQTSSVDPVNAKIKALEETITNMVVENEVVRLSGKFKDFDVEQVMKVAQDKQLSNLEDAYHLWKQGKGTVGAPDIESLKAQIKADLLKEMEAERNTDTIINTKGVPATNTTVRELSTAEKKVAKNMGLTEAEYSKWKNA